MRSFFALILCVGTSVAIAADAPLLHVSAGRLPNDTASEGQTKFTLVDSDELGGKALKVVFGDGDAFGNKGTEPSDWKAAAAVKFDMFNPGAKAIPLHFNIRHKKSTNYQTRVDIEFELPPGKHTFRFPIAEMKNVNGTPPDLSSVAHWYFSTVEGQAPTLLLGDVVLESGSAEAKPAAVGNDGEGFRITGTIGGQTVDLIARPLRSGAGGNATTPAATKVAIAVDPARLARIRAAKMPPVTTVVEFNTPQADAILTALEVFPPDNPWNQLVTDWPVHPRSRAIIATVGAEKPLRYNPDMSFIIVPPGQKKIDVKIVEYPEESDPGPYPAPDNIPIEGWPVSYLRDPAKKAFTLLDVQRDKANEEGDRHALVVDPTNRMLYEFYQMKRTDRGWQAAGSAIFDLKSNKLRPDGWTSTDAAGLPIFPAVVRYDELQRGEIEHALRFTIRRSRRAYVAPATHFASSLTDEDLPRMGERLRLRKDFDTSGFSPEVKTILNALKKYGMLVADNGIEWAISVAPDPRIPVLHDELRKVKGSDFEVVVSP